MFTLAEEFIGSGDFKAQARFITEIWGGFASEYRIVFRSGENDREDSHRQEGFTKAQSGSLHNRALLCYLAERGISGNVAMPSCKEIRCALHRKRYFTVGFRDVSGGYEVRNRFFKASLPPKDVSPIDNGSDTYNLFEGFIDCPSQMQPELGCGDNYPVLNSAVLLERSFPVLDRYEGVDYYLDRDGAGRCMLEALRKRYIDKVVNCSSLYKGHKDLNECLQNKFL